MRNCFVHIISDDLGVLAMKILNLTQHVATPEQIAAGVFEPTSPPKKVVQDALTFNDLPNDRVISQRARQLANIALMHNATHAMIGGAGYLIPELETELFRVGIIPLHSFTKRETVEETQPDGSVKKTAIFRHVGWVRTNHHGLPRPE